MEKLLKLENVSYSYQDGKEKNKILEHVSYSFEKGKIYAVVGASGSGKTTTLSLSSGLDKPDEGKVLFKGKDIQEIGLNKYRREDISIVFQSYNLIYYMNALENVMSALEIAGIKRKDKKEYCLSILEQLGLSKDECKRDIRQLSGGQQQRVAIAIALANNPKLLLADEPTGAVDRKTADDILEMFRKLNEKLGLTIVIVTHDKELAKKVNRVVSIRDGKTSSERIMKNDYRERMEHLDIDWQEEETQEEFAVLDRAGRVQIPPTSSRSSSALFFFSSSETAFSFSSTKSIGVITFSHAVK